MPRTTAKPTKAANHKRPSVPAEKPEVLTLAEAAAYLRLPEAEVTRLVHSQDLPGRFTGQEWRFLKSAIQEWLSTPPPRHSKESLLSLAGAWKDDPFVEQELKEIYERRGRPMTEDES